MKYKSLLVPALFCGFCMQNSAFWTSIQVSLGTRPHLLFCAYKTAWLAPELLVSLGTSPYLWFCAFKPATLGPKLHDSMGLRPHLSFCASNTAWLASESLVSLDPSPYVWFLDAKQRLLDWNKKSEWVPGITHHFALANQRDLHQNEMSLWVPALICGSFMQNSDFKTRLTSLYGSQTSCVVLSIYNSVLSIRITSPYGSLPSCVVYAYKTATFGPE